MSEDTASLELEAAGETIGEAKWLALRELERLYPGLDRELVTFEVLSEGERGLLGVGTSPARVRAHLDAAALTAPARLEEPALVAAVRETVEEICDALGARCRVDVAERETEVQVSVSGPGSGLVIGRQGRTIDAIQYLVGAVAYRLQPEAAKRVVVDAAGYCERRRTRLEALARNAAERAHASGEPVVLEPMTSIERKLIHVALQETAGVETRSEGEEPHRFVVIAPAGGT